MEFKGTKGKWIVTPMLNVSSEDGFLICDMQANVQFEEMKANALLISKAPEMLEMLINLKSELEQNKDAILELMEYQDGWDSDYERLKGKIEKLEQLIKEAKEL